MKYVQIQYLTTGAFMLIRLYLLLGTQKLFVFPTQIHSRKIIRQRQVERVPVTYCPLQFRLQISSIAPKLKRVIEPTSMDYQRQTTAEIKDCHLAGLLGEQPRF
jgi:hypothetical protein